MSDETAHLCRCCGNCCRWPGYVRVTEKELDAIAAFFGAPVREFIDTYCRLTRNRAGLSLVEQPDGSCIFLAPDNRCRIQPVKPRQCVEFPEKWSTPDLESVCLARRRAL